MEGILVLIVLLLATGLVIGFWVTVFAKAGYSPWLGVLMMLPLVSLILPIVFSVREWPIEREVRQLRMRCGLGKEEDAYALIREAIRLEAKGRFDHALLKYQEVATEFRDTMAGKDAEQSIEALRAGFVEA